MIDLQELQQKKLLLKKLKMKILHREVKACENCDGTFTNVLILKYSHMRKFGSIQIRDYEPLNEKEDLKAIRKAVRELYEKEKEKA
ncbi:MAG: hypothetical protein COB66_08065 [Coxiella sp. (in: Bacteria)]|nr:MAG: hypothetical protein COB66_08065 [Coxiella sp. (in: g-proteobacteria)]